MGKLDVVLAALGENRRHQLRVALSRQGEKMGKGEPGP